MSHERLRIELLGSPRAFDDGKPVSVSRRRVRAVLYYLAAERRPVSRATLAWMLWPDKAPATANRNLSIHLSYLKNALSEDIVDAAAGDIALSPAVESDMEEFFKLSATGSEDDIIAAHRLFRGAFLEGFSLKEAEPFERWIKTERTRWSERRCAVTLQTATILESREIYDTALSLIAEIIDENPTREDLYRHGMRIASKAQLPDAIEQLFARLTNELNREYGTTPTLQTAQYYRKALNKGEKIIAQPIARRNVFEKSDAPLVGRDRELGAVLSTPKGSAALVIGRSGMGKTRLLAETAKRIDGRRFFISFTDKGQKAPFSALAESLRTAEMAHQSVRTRNRVTSKLDEGDIARIARVMRSFHAHRLDDVPTSPVSLDEIGESFERLLSVLASERPLHFFIDDLQYADEPTLKLVERLVARSEFRQSSFVMTLSCCDPSPCVLQFLNRLQHANRLTTVELSDLKNSDIAQVIRQYYPTLPDDSVRQLSSLAKGSPFWMKGIVREIDLGHAVFKENDPAETLLDASISLLSPEALDLMTLLAVADMPIEVRLADALAQTDDASESITELASLGLIRRDACQKISLPNREMRDAVLHRRNLAPDAVPSANLRLARAMEALYGEAPAGVQDLLIYKCYLDSSHPDECGIFAARSADYLMIIGDEEHAIRYLIRAQRYLNGITGIDVSLVLFSCLARCTRSFEAKYTIEHAIAHAEQQGFDRYAIVLRAIAATTAHPGFALVREGGIPPVQPLDAELSQLIRKACAIASRSDASPLAEGYMQALSAAQCIVEGRPEDGLHRLEALNADRRYDRCTIGYGLFSHLDTLCAQLETALKNKAASKAGKGADANVDAKAKS